MLFYWYKTKTVTELSNQQISINLHFRVTVVTTCCDGTKVNHGKGLLCSDQHARNDYKVFFVFEKSEYIHHSINLCILSLSKKIFDEAVHHSLRPQQVLVRHVATGDT